MLHEEFTKRVGISVSYQEFDAIHVVYMASELDKDEFCKAWKKMNAKRIKAYKAEKKEEQEYNKFLQRIDKIFDKLFEFDGNDYIDLVTTEKEQEDLKRFGIRLSTYSSYAGYDVTARVYEVRMQLRRKAEFFKSW